MLKFRRVGAAKVLLAVLIFVMAAFILLSFSKEKFDARALLFMALTMLLIMVQHMRCASFCQMGTGLRACSWASLWA